MELKQLRQKSADELKAHLVELQQGAASRCACRRPPASCPSKTHEPRRVRREIARVNTLLGALQNSARSKERQT